jgi:hypothetical protein
MRIQNSDDGGYDYRNAMRLWLMNLSKWPLLGPEFMV